jgi:hypothetical protein
VHIDLGGRDVDVPEDSWLERIGYPARRCRGGRGADPSRPTRALPPLRESALEAWLQKLEADSAAPTMADPPASLPLRRSA